MWKAYMIEEDILKEGQKIKVGWDLWKKKEDKCCRLFSQCDPNKTIVGTR